jgi:Tfp pilus assembly protein PilF
VRKKDLGTVSLGAADCHYCMAILYKKLNVIDSALDHFTKALNIRRELIGPLSNQVGDILLKIG